MNPSEKIEDEAVLWVIRLERGLTAVEQDQFLEWFAANPRHGEALMQQKAGWTRLDLLADLRPAPAAKPNPDLLAPAAVHARRMTRRCTAWYLPLAVSAACLAAFFSANQTGHVPPGALVSARLTIAPIERRTLPDGSTVLLNRGAELVVKYTEAERRVSLARGEAHFEVAKDAQRPFTVETGSVMVRAVGTAFTVQLRSAAVQILVIHGKVDVQPGRLIAVADWAPRPPTRVEAGNSCIVPLRNSARPVVAAVTAAEIDASLIWKPRLIEFTEAPLAFILTEFNRHNAPYQINSDDPALNALVLSASLRSDNVEGFLDMLAEGFGIEAERSGSKVTLHRRRSR